MAAEPVSAPHTGTAAAERGFGGKLWFWLPWPLLVALDLWSKAAAFGFVLAEAKARGLGHLPEHQVPAWLVFDSRLLRLDLVCWGNTGTIWGLFQGSTLPLMVVRCAAVVGLLWFVWTLPRAARFRHLVLSLVFAGALGNLYDNFVRADRSVRDFLFFSGRWPVEWTFPAFNVADSCITVGAIGLFVLLWRDDRKPKPGPVSSPDTTA